MPPLGRLNALNEQGINWSKYSMDLYEQIRGMADCREGLPPQSKDESYLNGYGMQYQLNEINDNNKGKEYGFKEITAAANH